MLVQRNKQYFWAFLFGFILFFLQFLSLLNLSFFNQLANYWKERNFRVLQKIAHPFNRFSLMWNLTARLEDLQYRYSEAAAVLVKMESLEKENQELRKILENSDRTYQSTVVAAPVVSFAQSFVTVGSQAGIKIGAAVLYKDNLLGLIEEVQEKQSKVSLLAAMTENGVLAETKSGHQGLLKGTGREIILTEIAGDAKVEMGELVYTSSQVDLEKGLLVGKISRLVTSNQAEAGQTFVVEQLVNFYDLSLVEIK
jgi:cell shape-determining protein MreC